MSRWTTKKDRGEDVGRGGGRYKKQGKKSTWFSLQTSENLELRTKYVTLNALAKELKQEIKDSAGTGGSREL